MVLAMECGVRRPLEQPQMPMEHDEGGALHERLVAYVHALSDPHEARTGVWMEHSYARARGSVPVPGDARVLLAPRLSRSRADADLDVERLDPPPPDPPGDHDPPSAEHPDDHSDDDDNSDSNDDDWEERAALHAPSADCARLVRRVAESVHAQRLAVLVGGGLMRREAARASCRRLRAALAPLWAAVGAQPRAPAWLHTTLMTHLPRRLRSLYEEALVELRRSAPRLADRMGAGAGVVVGASAAVASEPATVVESSASPWLVWVEAGGEHGRWARRLRSLVHTRVLPLEYGAGGVGGAGGVEAAECARAALADILVEAGDRPVVVGGAGGGAALASVLVGGVGGRVRGLVLVAPLLGAGEESRALSEVRVPVLVVWGGCGGAGRMVGAGVERRAVEVRGADGALRVSPAMRARLRLTQHALDAAILEECVRWTLEVSEGGETVRTRRVGPPSPPTPPPPPSATPTHRPHSRRSPASTEAKYFYPRAAARVDNEPVSRDVTTPAPPTPPTPPVPPTHHTPTVHATTPRAIEIVEGRVVSRVSGGTPLALLPPRRVPPSPSASAAPAPAPTITTAPTPLAAADIMQMPIVFADDERAGGGGGGGGGGGSRHETSLTVRSGRTPTDSLGAPALSTVRYARVIVAKRGGSVGAGVGRGGATRGVLLRRAARRERH